MALDFQTGTGIKEIYSKEGDDYLLKCFAEAEPSYAMEIQGEPIEIMTTENSKILNKKLTSLPFQIFLILDQKDEEADFIQLLNEISTVFLAMYDKNSLHSWKVQPEIFTPFIKVIRSFFIEERGIVELMINLHNNRGEKEESVQQSISPQEKTIFTLNFTFTLLWNGLFCIAGILLFIIDYFFIVDTIGVLIFTYLWGGCFIGVLINIVGKILKVKDMKVYEYTAISFLICLNSIIMGQLTYTALTYFFSS